MNNIEVTTLTLGTVSTNCYIARAEGSDAALIIDPADDAGVIIQKCEELRVKPAAMLLTHGHFDHILAAEELRRKLKIPVIVGEGEYIDYSVRADGWLLNGDIIDDAGFDLRVIETPGHTAGSVCYYQPDAGVLFSGDTLFKGTFGRTDLPGGDLNELKYSVTQILFALPDGVVVYPGHGEKTLLGYEKKMNYILSPMV